MSTAPTLKLSAAHYLAMDRASEVRHEYLNGEIFAMGGATFRHNQVVTRLLVALDRRIRGQGCQTTANDLRVQITPTGLYAYPDLVVVCGEPQFADSELDTLLNPRVLVEVLSDSTEAYDRGLKFAHYRTLATLQDYVLVAQDRPSIERYSRIEHHRWEYWASTGVGDNLQLPSLGCEIPLGEIYPAP